MTSKVPAYVVAMLKRLYLEMSGYIALQPGCSSRTFKVQRGVRQGDPLSPLLFNLVLDGVLEEARKIWRQRKYGTNVGQDVRGDRITHVAFADDQILVARTWLPLKRMILTLKESLARRGLSLHPSKCKVQTNVESWKNRGDVVISRGFSVYVLPEGEPLVLLGTALALTDATGTEVTHRMASAWRMFWACSACC